MIARRANLIATRLTRMKTAVRVVPAKVAQGATTICNGKRTFDGRPWRPEPLQVTLTDQDLVDISAYFLSEIGRKPTISEAMAYKVKMASLPKKGVLSAPKGRRYGKRVNGKLVEFASNEPERVERKQDKVFIGSFGLTAKTLSKLSGNFR